MPQAYIVDCARTAGGKKNGALSKWHPADLGAVVVDEIIRRNNIDGSLIDDVIFGCVAKYGAQTCNIGRNVVLSSSLPKEVPGTTVDRQCGSSQQALHFAAQAVMSGNQDCVIAGGVELMSLVPIGSDVTDAMAKGRGMPNGQNIKARYGDKPAFSQFDGAEMLAQKVGLSREEMDKFAVLSHARADEATKTGRFKREIVPVRGLTKEGQEAREHSGLPSILIGNFVLDRDEGIRADTNLEKLSQLKTLRPGGSITAATSSQISDGASAVLVCSEKGLRKLGLKPRARIVEMAVVGDDPVLMLYGPVPASQKVLQRAGKTIADIDLYEVNEAFASVPLAWRKELGADMNKLNVNGGAMALGHPLGSTGTKLMTTLVHELERRNARFGLLAICEGGGTANATIVENLAATGSRL